MIKKLKDYEYMGPQEQILALARAVLEEKQGAQTGEALAKEVSKKFGRPLPTAQVVKVLQSKPQIFTVDGGGRWQLRVQQEILLLDEAEPLTEQAQPMTSATHALKRGCYIVFDLEATRQDALSPYNEIIQIAAERWIDGQCCERWMRFVRPQKKVQERIHQLTKIRPEELVDAQPIQEVLPEFLAFVGDLPLMAHNGASYDGPLIRETCHRLHIPLPETFLVLDTLPLARTLLPTVEAHRVSTLYEHFGHIAQDAHRADADVAMLSTIILHLQQIMREEESGRAAYELLCRANDPWTHLLTPPATTITIPEIIATFGAQITPLLPEPISANKGSVDNTALEEIFVLAEAEGRSRREAQVTMSHVAAEALRTGGYAIIEAGTGTGKSQGYLIPAALYARATGRPVAISTLTRILQEQLVTRELPFIQKLLPEISYAQLQGRANYLSLSRLAEEVEDALAKGHLAPHRAWMLATLVRFAASSAHGNLEELGVIPQALDSFLQSDGAVHQILSSVRASQDDRPGQGIAIDFYRRARENADRANLVVVNHALLLKHNLGIEEEETPFAGVVICDEAHTLEDAATSALEKRVEERVLRRILRAIYTPRRGGLVNESLRRLKIPQEHETLRQLVQIVDKAQASLDSLNERLHHYVNSQIVIARAERERYGVSVRIDRSALGMAGGNALKTAYQTTGETLHELRATLAKFITEISTVQTGPSTADAKRRQRIVRVARSLQRDLRTIVEHYQWFWKFEQGSSYVSVIELEKCEADGEASINNTAEVTTQSRPASSAARSSASTNLSHPNRQTVVMRAVPINVGPLLWEQLWSRLDATICTSATLTIYSQGFDFFLRRVGLEHEHVEREAPHKQIVTCELPHTFDYHAKALLMLPNNLPAPRDSKLKHNFQATVADLLRRFIPTFEGKTLGLFTANSRRDFVYEQIVDGLAEKGFPVLRQGGRGACAVSSRTSKETKGLRY